jgi:hypothetical protein
MDWTRQMNLKEIKIKSTLGRPLDPSYRTNLIVLIITPILAIISGVYVFMSDSEFMTALQAAFWMALAVFEAWALAREIDPDNDWSAFVAVALIVIAMFVLNFPAFSIIALFVSTMALRLTNRIVGPPATRSDSVLVLILVLIAAFFDSWLIGLIAAGGFLLDATMSEPNRRHLAFAGGAVAIVVVRGIISLGTIGNLSTNYIIAMVVVGIFYILTILANRSATVGTDIQGYPVDIRRFRAAMILALIAVIILALWRGDIGVIAMLPLWCAMLGISIYRLPITIRELLSFNQARKQA